MSNNNDKGTAQSISFSESNLDLYEYMREVAEQKHGGSFSIMVMDAIKCHRHVTNVFGDWRQVDTPPGWASDILTAKSTE